MPAGARARRRRRARPSVARSLVPGLVLLTLLVAVVLLRGAYPELERRFRPSGPDTTPYADIFRAAAARFPDVPAAQLAAQARAESNFDPAAVSPAGAQGLMQIIPETFARFAVDGNDDGVRDPFQPADSVFTAAAYLGWLATELDLDVSDERVVAAYNAGPNAVRRTGGVPDYPETRDYVERVLAWAPDYAWLDV